MGRPRKEDKQKETAELMISVEDFARTRDSRTHLSSMPASAFLPSAQARQARAGLSDMSRQLQELIAAIPLVLAQLRLYPDPQFFLQVVTGLTTLQTAVSDLLRSYLKHTNSVLGSTPYRLDTFGISNPLNNNEILAGALRDSPPAVAGPSTTAAPQPALAPAPAAAAPAPAEEEPVKKGRKPKKEKKERDPNEPKRPLTIYFLFAAHARPIVKSDLGPDATPGTVEEEIKKRWRELPEEDKDAWKEIYAQNREEYKVKIDAYKKERNAAVGNAKSSAVDENGDVDMAEDAATAAGADADETSETTSEESEKEPTPPPKAPTPPVESKTPKTKRRKTAKENGAVAASSAAAPAHAASPIPLPSHPKPVESTPLAKSKPERKSKKDEPPKEASEEPAKKKRGRKSKGAEELAVAADAEPAVEAPAPEKKNKRKRKSDAVAA
ncbi:high mobility group protein [Neofusicoccum ribis]|uniref:High mobility group protein n=1 Tax=Neofusicoccum ribis TaxID=45134 RepID=A0ABR3SEK1_9PEZI